ncbi:UNKNOWN [Stylonychia lemnae]|uniref:Uncharacterized protein n=1 Tax=Stylonychia lemnae TaxID=5949 RepID=A0A077ZSZ4_STYLE|nr:UNKNOWN [Stylonychia lemnae]|eukprot:CDW73008.1 UNKNOWN [Stylonychia lemnae]
MVKPLYDPRIHYIQNENDKFSDISLERQRLSNQYQNEGSSRSKLNFYLSKRNSNHEDFRVKTGQTKLNRNSNFDYDLETNDYLMLKVNNQLQRANKILNINQESQSYPQDLNYYQENFYSRNNPGQKLKPFTQYQTPNVLLSQYTSQAQMLEYPSQKIQYVKEIDMKNDQLKLESYNTNQTQKSFVNLYNQKQGGSLLFQRPNQKRSKSLVKGNQKQAKLVLELKSGMGAQTRLAKNIEQQSQHLDIKFSSDFPKNKSYEYSSDLKQHKQDKPHQKSSNLLGGVIEGQISLIKQNIGKILNLGTENTLGEEVIFDKKFQKRQESAFVISEIAIICEITVEQFLNIKGLIYELGNKKDYLYLETLLKRNYMNKKNLRI